MLPAEEVTDTRGDLPVLDFRRALGRSQRFVSMKLLCSSPLPSMETKHGMC